MIRILLFSLTCLCLTACQNPAVPEAQRDFENRLEAIGKLYKKGDSSAQRQANEATAIGQRGALFHQLAASPEFTDWICTVKEVHAAALATQPELVLNLDCGFFSLRNAGDLIERSGPSPQAIMQDSPLYGVVQSLGRGDRVSVSGDFQVVRGKIRECSLTTSGGMSEPEFGVIFTNISLQ